MYPQRGFCHQGRKKCGTNAPTARVWLCYRIPYYKDDGKGAECCYTIIRSGYIIPRSGVKWGV